MKNWINRIRKIFDFYGPKVETEKFFEEIEELKETIKNDDRENISQEIADVFITSIHMMFKYDISFSDVQKQIEHKIERQEDRIHKEQLKEYSLSINNKKKLNKYLDELIKREG